MALIECKKRPEVGELVVYRPSDLEPDWKVVVRVTWRTPEGVPFQMRVVVVQEDGWATGESGFWPVGSTVTWGWNSFRMRRLRNDG